MGEVRVLLRCAHQANLAPQYTISGPLRGPDFPFFYPPPPVVPNLTGP